MTSDQVTAFQANSGFGPSDVSVVLVGGVFVVLLLWGVWALRTAYVGWAAAVGHQVNRQMEGQPKWTGPVYVTVAMRCPRANSDIDNRLKGLGDLLQAHGVIANDKHIHGWNAFWSDTLPEGIAAEISITPTSMGKEAA